MNCSRTMEWADAEYLERFRRKVIANRIPISGSIDLTQQCNLRCVHCYLSEPDDGTGNGELDTSRWKSIIDEIAAAGCLYLLITGGDPLLRKDFTELYLHAKQKGLIITVFTNGTTLTDEILDLWQHYPPRLVEITLYGATVDTYRKITGSGRALAACVDTIHRLKTKGIPVGLKTILMSLNHDEFRAMESIAAGLGCPFRYDGAIFPKFSGDRSVIGLRVEPAEVARLDFASPARAQEWVTTYQRLRGDRNDNRLYSCGSGKTSFHITADGILQPCLMCREIRYDLRRSNFADGWRRALPLIDRLTMPAISRCTGCDRKILCGYCPPFSALENGQTGGRSEYLCRLGEYRHHHLVQYLNANENTEITA